MEYAFSLFLAIMLAFFVGIAVDVAYPQKVHYEKGPSGPGASDVSTSYPVYEYDEARERNVSLIWLGIAGVMVVAGLNLNKKFTVFSHAFIGSGIFLTVGSLMRGGPGPNSNEYRLISIIIILITSGYFGYRRFLR